MIEKNEQSGMYDVEIDGATYSFSKWGASDSLRILTRLARIIAEPMGVLVGNLAAGVKGGFSLKGLLDLDFKPEMVSGAVRALMFNLDEDTTLNLVKKFASDQVLCDGAKINFDMHYQDRLEHLYSVVQAGLEVQYGNFLGALKGRLAAMAPPQRGPISNKGHLTSTGTSGRRS